MSMAVSLNLTVGILGELSLGHAGFMSVGAFSGIVVSQSLAGTHSEWPRAPASRHLWRFSSARSSLRIIGFLIGIPVLRLRGDYLAIVTLAFGEIIKECINCLYHRPGQGPALRLQPLRQQKTVDDLGLEGERHGASSFSARRGRDRAPPPSRRSPLALSS